MTFGSALLRTDAGVRSPTAAVLGFVTDTASQAALREGLADLVAEGLELRRGTIRDAVKALSRMPAPRGLIADVSGDAQPMTALADLAAVIEPDVRVLIIGERDDLAFYRQITQGIGVQEYLYKPLVPDMVARYFAPLLGGEAQAGALTAGPGGGARGGRLITVTGMRGGAGASTVAANLAWHIAGVMRRHAVLLDADLERGTAALLLGVEAGPGLYAMLAQPDRVDELFIERSVVPAGDRLHVLAGEPSAGHDPPAPAGPAHLLELLRRRWNFVVADTPLRADPFNHALLEQAQQRIAVLPATLPGVLETRKFLSALQTGAAQVRRPVLVLNRVGAPGALSRAQVEDALGVSIDLVLRCNGALPRAEGLGSPAIVTDRAFAADIATLAREVTFAGAAPAPERGWLRWRS